MIEEALESCARFGVKPGLEAIRAVCAAMVTWSSTQQVFYAMSMMPDTRNKTVRGPLPLVSAQRSVPSLPSSSSLVT